MFRKAARRKLTLLFEEMGGKLVEFYLNVSWRKHEQCSHGHFDPPAMFKSMASARYELHLLATQLRVASGSTTHAKWVGDMIERPPELVRKNIGRDEWIEGGVSAKKMGPFPALTSINDLVQIPEGFPWASFPAIETFDEYVLKDPILRHLVTDLGISLVDLCELVWRGRQRGAGRI